MTSTWPTEGKAQAVCARSYAINSVGYSADSNYKKAYYMDDTTKFQVYGDLIPRAVLQRLFRQLKENSNV